MQTSTESTFTKKALVGLGILIVILGVFMAGVSLGERKSRHFSGWCQNYGDMFNFRRGGDSRMPFPAPVLPFTHGVFGKVLSVEGSTVMVQGKDGLEQTVLVTSSTLIRDGRDPGTIENIRPGTEAAVLGDPNGQGQIDARLIRLINAP